MKSNWRSRKKGSSSLSVISNQGTVEDLTLNIGSRREIADEIKLTKKFEAKIIRKNKYSCCYLASNKPPSIIFKRDNGVNIIWRVVGLEEINLTNEFEEFINKTKPREKKAIN